MFMAVGMPFEFGRVEFGRIVIVGDFSFVHCGHGKDVGERGWEV